MYELSRHEGLHPVAGFSLSAIEFGRRPLLGQIKELSPEQLTAKPEVFKNSIATLVVHIAATEASFAHLIMGKPMADELKAEFLLDQPRSPLPAPETATAEGLMALLEKSKGYLREALGTVKEADLSRQLSFGPDVGATVEFALALLPIHQAQHAGQIQLLKQRITQ